MPAFSGSIRPRTQRHQVQRQHSGAAPRSGARFGASRSDHPAAIRKPPGQAALRTDSFL